jgi:hypothetical protein
VPRCLGLCYLEQSFVVGFGVGGGLLVELAPFLLRPAQLLHGRGEVQEVDGDDVGAWAQVRVPYECVELPPSLDQTFTDAQQSCALFGRVSRPILAAQTRDSLIRAPPRPKVALELIERTSVPARAQAHDRGTVDHVYPARQ